MSADPRIPTPHAFVRLQEDPVRGGWALQAPERVLTLDEIAHAIVSRCDGAASVDEIVASLAAEYDAPAGEIRTDVLATLNMLVSRDFLSFRDGAA
ncbi:MAG: pyrroloquinoline quinone biosynthesis peptide chaperone PqqD [Pseudomonadota bacterium]